jgi:ubiquinone/menaquinone biosynthesis C-methylase UbiE
MAVAALCVPFLAPAQPGASTASLPASKILELLGVREGGTVCEIGAGSGDMSVSAARTVGPNGRVFTNELGEDHLKRLREKVLASGLANITIVEGESTKTNLPEGACDGLFLRDVYHHFTEPGPIDRSILASLKPGGRVAVIDFAPQSGKEAERPSDRGGAALHGVTAPTVVRELKEAGFEVADPEKPPERWFLVVASKPK